MQKSLNLLLILITSIGIYTSCAKKSSGQKSKVKFKIQMSIVSDEYPGGVYIWGNQPTGDEHFSIVLSDANENEEIELDSTKEWDFFAIGWIGSEALTGTNICGFDLGKNFSGASETVTFDFNEINCDHPEISASEYLEGNQFLPIKFVTCNTIENVVAGGDCDTLNGDFSSFKIKLLAHNSNEPGMQMEGLNSECLNLTSGSFESSTFKLPAGGSNSLGLWYEINGYTEVGCVGDKKVFHMNKGLNNTLTSGVKVFADSGYTEVFLLADGNGESSSGPSLNTVSPVVIAEGDTLSLVGSNFQSGVTVVIGESSVCASVTLIDANNVTCEVPDNEPGSYNVTVTNPNNQSSTLVNGITYQSGASISLAVDGSPAGNSYNFGTHPTNVTIEQVFEITNNGASTINTISFSELETPFEVLPQDCVSILSVGQTCEFTLRFIASEVDDFDANLVINFIDEMSSTGTYNLSLSGTTIELATLDFIPAGIVDFELVTIGATEYMSVVIENNGSSTISEIILPELESPYTLINGSCADTLGDGEECSFDISFTPTDDVPYSDNISISFNDGISSQTTSLPITGIGEQGIANLIFVGPSLIDFETVQAGSSHEHFITIENNGNAVATNISWGTLETPFQVFTGGSGRPAPECTSSLEPNTECTIGIVLNAEQANFFNPAFNISYNDGQDPGFMPAFNLTANVTPGPLAQLVRTDSTPGSIVGSPLNIIIEVQDAFGNLVLSNERLTISINSGSGSLVGGDNFIDITSGVANFISLPTYLSATGLYSLRITTGEGISLDITSFTVNNP